MRPKKTEKNQQMKFFNARLELILNLKHPLFVLANQIAWAVFDEEFR